jgi:hypothetical protein
MWVWWLYGVGSIVDFAAVNAAVVLLSACHCVGAAVLLRYLFAALLLLRSCCNLVVRIDIFSVGMVVAGMLV